MPRYKVIVEGRNFSWVLEGERENVGFFTTFILEADSDAEIKRKTRDLLLIRLNENTISGSTMDKARPYFFINRVYKSEEDSNPQGSTWYKISKFGLSANEVKYFIARFLLHLKLKNEFYAPERLPARLLKVDLTTDAG